MSKIGISFSRIGITDSSSDKRISMNMLNAQEFKKMLLDIYQCQKTFELLLVDKWPKTRMGFYIVDKMRIRIYSKWGKYCPLEEIAIHEYAHHIHETEKRRDANRRKERVHGPEFWRIYSALMSVAQKKGIFTDDYIAGIVLLNMNRGIAMKLYKSIPFLAYNETDYDLLCNNKNSFI